jgi:hypothetical protein
MATYAAVFGPEPPATVQPTVALAPDGNVWIASRIDAYPGAAHTLIAVNADGSRVFHSASFPAIPQIAFDGQNSVYAALSTEWPNLRTSLDAPRRGWCEPSFNLYLLRMGPDGSFREATYLPGRGRIVAFEGPDRLFIGSSQRDCWLDYRSLNN